MHDKVAGPSLLRNSHYTNSKDSSLQVRSAQLVEFTFFYKIIPLHLPSRYRALVYFSFKVLSVLDSAGISHKLFA
jgi:hypothetical protein